jgi:hypothetical protein
MSEIKRDDLPIALMLSGLYPCDFSFLMVSATQDSQTSWISLGSCECHLCKNDECKGYGYWTVVLPGMLIILRKFELVLGDDIGELIENKETCRASGEQGKIVRIVSQYPRGLTSSRSRLHRRTLPP